MNTKETYLNSPIKSCITCVHSKKDKYLDDWLDCTRWRISCAIAVKWHDYCGPELKSWRPKPPRRSLRQWLYDALLK